MATPKLETEVQVMFFDTDAGGVVHNIAYLRFIETNRSLLAEKLGWPLGEMLTVCGTAGCTDHPPQLCAETTTVLAVVLKL